MAETQNSAKEVYEELCGMLDARGWRYTRHDDDLVVTFGVSGDDIPMDYFIKVDGGRQLVSLYSRLPFIVPEEKRMEAAIAVCAATFGLVDGNFDYNINTGKITFRQTASFRSSKIGQGLFKYLIDWACAVVDRYNDRFMSLCSGAVSFTDFLDE